MAAESPKSFFHLLPSSDADPVTGDFKGIWILFFNGCFGSMDVCQWELGIFKGILNLDGFFNESKKPYISYIGIIMNVPRKSQNFPNHVNSWEFWDYH